MNAVVPRGGTFGSFAGRPQGLRASIAAPRHCFQANGIASKQLGLQSNLGFKATWASKQNGKCLRSLSIPRWNRRQGTLPRLLTMTDPHHRSDSSAAPHDRYIAALDGLRGTAAMLVAGGHYMAFEGGAPLSVTASTLVGLGMTLFFVLSGFVIHYNYNMTITRPGGTRAFFVARFARLYPLYLLLFLFDFSYTGLTARSACGQIGAPDEHWLGIAFYLSLTQSWIYATICRASLPYQYGPVAAVSWSISVEIFFYLAYVVVAMLIARRKWSPRDVIVLAATAFSLVVVYFLLCRYYEEDINRLGLAIFGSAASTDNGYENSLMRWLLYFNPAARLGEFLAGLAVAQLYLARWQGPATLSAPRASAATLTAILAVV